MIKAIFVLWFGAFGAFAIADGKREQVARQKWHAAEVAVARMLRTEKLPSYELEQVSLLEALEVLRSSWEKKHPRVPFPVELGDFDQLADAESWPGARSITVSLQDVTYWDAVLWLAADSYSGLKPKNEALKIAATGYRADIENWRTQSYSLSPRVLAELKLTANSSQKSVRQAFGRYEIALADWMKVSLSKTGDSLIVTTFQAKHEQIALVLHLLEKGFKIQK